MTERPDYQVALSFAGEQREYVAAVAKALQARGIAVFYDEFEIVRLWGVSLLELLHDVYHDRADYVVMFISEDYVRKPWTNHERRAALTRAVQQRAESVLPVRFDDTRVPGLPEDVSFLCAGAYEPAALSALIAEKLGVKRFSGKASHVPPPQMTSLVGEAIFDYSSCNGRFVIGDGPVEFETKWSKASDKAIHIYNDPPSINGIAAPRKVDSIGQISDAGGFDYTSRSRQVRLGGCGVFRNIQGFYAAVRVLEIKDDTRGASEDEVRFRYVIQPDGSGDFSRFDQV